MMGQSASTDQADILGSHTTTGTTANRTSIVTDNSHTELKAQLQCDGKGMKTCLELVLSMKNGKSAGVEPDTDTDDQKQKTKSDRGDEGEPNLSQDATPKEQQQQKQPSAPSTPTSASPEKEATDMKLGKSDSNDQSKSKLSDDAKRLVFNKNANLHDAIGALIRNCITETKFSPDHAQQNSSETKQTKELSSNVQHDKKFSMNAPVSKNYESNTVDNTWRAPGGYYQNHQPIPVGQKQSPVSENSETVAPSPKSWKGSGELARNGNQSSKPLLPSKDKMLPSPESVTKATGTGGQSVVQLQAFIDKCLENTWQQQKIGMSEKLATIGKGQFNYGNDVTLVEQHHHQQQQQQHTRNGHPEEVCIQSERTPNVQQMYHQNINQVAYYSEMAKQDRTSNGLDPSSTRKDLSDSRFLHSFQASNNKNMMEGIRDIRHHQQQQQQHPQSHHQQQQQQQYYTGSEMAAAALNQTYSNMIVQMHPGSSKPNQHSVGDGFESAFDAKELINKISCQARAINKFFSNSGEPSELPYHSSKMSQHPSMKMPDQQVDYGNKSRSIHSPASSPSHVMNRSQENPLGGLSNHKRMMFEEGRGISYIERLNHATAGKELQQHNISPNYRQHKDDASNIINDMNHLQANVATGARLQSDVQQRVNRFNQHQDMMVRNSQSNLMSKYSESIVPHQMYGPKDHSGVSMSHYQSSGIPVSHAVSMSSVTGSNNNATSLGSSNSVSHAKTMERILAAPHQQPHFMQAPGAGLIKWDDHASLNSRYHQISPQSAQSVKIRGASTASMPSPQEGDVLATMAASKNHSPRTHSNSSQSAGMLTPSFMSPSSSPLIHHKDGAAPGPQKLQTHYVDNLGKSIGAAPGDSSLRGSVAAAATTGGMVPQRRHTVSDMANFSSEPSKLQHASMRPLSAPDAAVISAATAAMPANIVGRKPRVEGENVLDLSVKRKANEGPSLVAGNAPGSIAPSSASQSASNQDSPLDLSKKRPEEQFLMMSSGGSRGREMVSPGSSFHSASAAAAGAGGKSVPANILLKHLEYSVQKYCGNIGSSNPATAVGAASHGPNIHPNERVNPQSAASQTNPLNHHHQQQHLAQPHLMTAQQHPQSQTAHPPHHPQQQQHYQPHHSQPQQQHQAYQKQGLTASQMIMPQQARGAEFPLHPTSQYISNRKDFPHGYVTAESHHRQSQQNYPIFRQPTLPVLPKHGPHLQTQQQPPPPPPQQQQPQPQQQQPPSQTVVQPQSYQLSPVASQAATTQNVSAYPPQNMEPAQNNHRNSKSANSTNEKLDNNCSKKHDISKHEPVQNLLGNHAPDDVLYLICKLCGQTYGSPYSFRKHFRNQHGFEPRPHHTVVQSISATISLLKGKPPEANAMVKNEDTLQLKSVSNPGSVADSRVDIKKIEAEDQKFDVSLCTATNSSSFKSSQEEAASQNRNLLENPISSQEETKFLECPECRKQFQLNDFGSYKKHCRSHERNKHGVGISEYAFEMSSQMWKHNLPADTEGRQCSSVPTPETISKERCPSDSGSSISVDRVLRPSSYSFDTPKSELSSQSSTAGSQNDNSNDTCKDYSLLSIHDIKQENDPYSGQLSKTNESQWSRTCIKTEAKCVDSKDGEEQPPVITDDPWYPSDDSSDEHRLKIVMSELDESNSVSVKKEDNQDTELTSDKSFSNNMDSSESFCDQSNTTEPNSTNVTPGGQPGTSSAALAADSNSNSSSKKQSDIASECDKPQVDNEDDDTFTYRHKKFQKFGSQFKRKDSNTTDSQDSVVDLKRKKISEVG